MATHSSILAWRIPGTEEPGGLPSIGSHRVGHDWSDLAAAAAARLLLLYSTIGKTSRLKMKSFSTVRDTQRGSQSYMEKRRGRRELEMTRMRWGGIKRGKSKLASYHFLICTHSLDHSEMFMELYREEKREEGDRGGQEDKRGEWKGER